MKNKIFGPNTFAALTDTNYDPERNTWFVAIITGTITAVLAVGVLTWIFGL